MGEVKKLVAEGVAAAIELHFGGRTTSEVKRISLLETQIRLLPKDNTAPHYFIVKVSEPI